MGEYKTTDKGAVGVSSVLRLNDEIRLFEARLNCYKELCIIKQTMLNGTYDFNLHKTVNSNESLSDLIGVYLPPPTNNDNNKTLLDEYVKHIDVALENILDDLKRICEAIYNAFVSWLSDYIDTLKRYRIRLKQFEAKLSMNRTFIGTKEQFESIEMYTYNYADWDKLMTTSETLSKVLDSMRPDNVVKWCEDNQRLIDSQLSEYGTRVEGKRVVRGNVKYSRITRRLKDLRWKQDDMISYVTRAIRLLDESIKDDKAGVIVREAHKNAVKEFNKPTKDGSAPDPEPKESLALAVGIFKMHKDNVAAVIRSLIMIIEAGVRNKYNTEHPKQNT